MLWAVFRCKGSERTVDVPFVDTIGIPDRLSALGFCDFPGESVVIPHLGPTTPLTLTAVRLSQFLRVHVDHDDVYRQVRFEVTREEFGNSIQEGMIVNFKDGQPLIQRHGVGSDSTDSLSGSGVISSSTSGGSGSPLSDSGSRSPSAANSTSAAMK